jgi:cytochrome c oxidase subunit II
VNIPNSILTMLAGILLTLASVWYGQNHGLMPVEASEDAMLVDQLFDVMMIVSTGIFLLVEGVLVICLFKFRRRAGDDTEGPPIAGNIPLEILWTAIPVVIVLVIGVYSFEIYRIEGGFDPEAADQPAVQVALAPETSSAGLLAGDAEMPLVAAPAPRLKHHNHMMALGVGGSPDNIQTAPDLTVNVLGLQYAWIFTYPDSGVTSGELHIPSDRDIKLVIKAQDVLHAFWLPQFRLKQDAIPGQDADPIICAELCGPYHGAMASKLYVHPPDEFDQWLQQQIAALPEPAQPEQTQVAVKSKAESEAESTVSETSPAQDAHYLAPFAQQIAQQTGITSSHLQQLHHHELHELHHDPDAQATSTVHPAAS